MNDQVKKRKNPFDEPIAVQPYVEEVVKEEIPVVEEEIIQQPVYREPVQSYAYAQQPVRQQRKTPKQQFIQPVDAQKDKYTATMEVSLRRKIKIYCATNGRMFSEFIEEACREKLSREGIK